MPIKFYKTNGVPKKTFANSEEIHFSDSGYIYVAAQNGDQQLMYRTAVSSVAQNDSKSLSYSTFGGDKGVIRFDFYSTAESNNRFITQSNPMIGEYKIYHEGFAPSGMMTELEKTKLLGISPHAEVNQNAYSTIEIDSTVLSANKKQDKITINPGKNINFSIDQFNKEVTINAVLDSSAIGSLCNIPDVEVSNLEHGDIMMFNGETQTWENGLAAFKEIYLKSPNGEVWAIGIQNDGQLYVENANITE